jgi:hypothetical protein
MNEVLVGIEIAAEVSNYVMQPTNREPLKDGTPAELGMKWQPTAQSLDDVHPCIRF